MGRYNLPPLKEKFRPQNSYLCHGRDEGTGSAFGPSAPKSPLQLGGFSKGLSPRIMMINLQGVREQVLLRTRTLDFLDRKVV